MKLVEDVFEIAESFMEKPEHVRINYTKINNIADTMLAAGKIKFPFPDEDDNVFKSIVLEIVAASINYCYWYGRHNVRPNNSSSTRMYELVMQAFSNFESQNQFESCIEKLIKLLAINRFPLIEERARHLRELKSQALYLANIIENRYLCGLGRSVDLTYMMEYLVGSFPGFASDIFLKRASLFFLQLNRKFGWFADELNLLHVPADYQVPKMLEHFGCTYYTPTLKEMIKNHQLIPKNSLEECEIRAATIIVVKKLCELTGWNVAEVDGFFFLNRHIATNPFHLTITTDY